MMTDSELNTMMEQVTFKGSNAAGEIETLEEFLLEVDHYIHHSNCQSSDKDDNDDVSGMNFEGWSFTDIDFCQNQRVVELWNQFNWNGSIFFGCSIPDTIVEMKQKGAKVAPQLEGVPFKVYRSFMYTQHELQKVDGDIYKFYLNNTSLSSKLAEQIHDHFVQDALFDYLEGKSVVSIMGGHQMKRSDRAYKEVVLMAYQLARKGFLVASGGGPGAMEACNLGAYLFQQPGSEIDFAIQLMIQNQDKNVEFEYQDHQGPRAIIDRYGPPTFQPSLAIPTYKYGHEPTNIFATWICKFFSNAIREDGLLDISNAGIIYTPGSAGTRQEIFQAACGNHYAEPGKEKPTIFYDTEFWNQTGIPHVLKSVSVGRPFAKWITESDNVDEIVSHIETFREQAGLPSVTPEQLQSKFWIRPALRGKADNDSVHKKACEQEERQSRRRNRNERAMRRQSIKMSDI